MTCTSLALLLALSLLPTQALARVHLIEASSPPRDVWLTPTGAFLPLEAAALGTRVGASFNYTSLKVLGVDISQSQLQLHGQVAFWDRLEIGLMIPILSVLAPDRGDDQLDIGNLRLGAKLKLWGRSGTPFTISYFLKATFPTYSDGDVVKREKIGYRLHHGLLASGEYRGAVYGVGVAPFHWITESARRHLMDIGGYVGYKLHRMIAAQVTIQSIVPLDPSGDPGVVLSPTLRFSPLESLYFDIGGRFALNDEGRINTGSPILPVGGRAQLALGVGYRW